MNYFTQARARRLAAQALEWRLHEAYKEYHMKTLAEQFKELAGDDHLELCALVNNDDHSKVSGVVQSFTSNHAVIRFTDRSRLLVNQDNSLTVVNNL